MIYANFQGLSIILLFYIYNLVILYIILNGFINLFASSSKHTYKKMFLH